LKALEAYAKTPLPRDLFNNEKPFVYRPSGSRYILYSIGPNHHDDGGRRRDARNTDDADDLPWPPVKRRFNP
jgi:hypothetical protein